MKKLSLRQALVAVVTAVLVVGLVPAGIALDRQLVAELERTARSDLAMAPKILADRQSMQSDALMMHAKDLAESPALLDAVAAGDRELARAVANRTVQAPGELPVLVSADGTGWTGPTPGAGLVERTRDGTMPVGFLHRDGELFRVSVAPLRHQEEWRGAAGVAVPVDESVAGTLGGLTRSTVVILGSGGQVVAATADSTVVRALTDSLPRWSVGPGTRELRASDGRVYWAALAPLEGAGVAVFLRSVEEALAPLPGLRRSALVALLLALGIAILLGGWLTAQMAQPVQALAEASRRLADGDFRAPVPESRIREVDRVSLAFRDMRGSLEDTIRELREANEELETRQARLQALQAELIQRDRLAATGRLVTELAHEIRNPVASVRNCLEIIRRKADPEAELQEFASMAIEELLRMHRLAEKMLDANRPWIRRPSTAIPGSWPSRSPSSPGPRRTPRDPASASTEPRTSPSPWARTR